MTHKLKFPGCVSTLAGFKKKTMKTIFGVLMGMCSGNLIATGVIMGEIKVWLPATIMLISATCYLICLQKYVDKNYTKN